MMHFVQGCREAYDGPHPALGEINNAMENYGIVSGAAQKPILQILEKYFPDLPANSRNQAAANIANRTELTQKLRNSIMKNAYDEYAFRNNPDRHKILADLFRSWPVPWWRFL